MTLLPVHPHPGYAQVPLSLLRAHAGEPPGIIAVIGDVLAEAAIVFQRHGWIVHLACRTHEAIRTAAQGGVRTVRHALPSGEGIYDAVVLALPGVGDPRETLAAGMRKCRSGAPLVITTDHQDARALGYVTAACGLRDPAVYVDEGPAVVLHLGQRGPLVAVACA